MKYIVLITCVFCYCLLGCQSSSEKTVPFKFSPKDSARRSANMQQPVVSSAAKDSVVSGGRVPILCYHQVRDWTSKDSKGAKVYIVPVNSFRDQMRLLKENGYHAILPDQLIAHLQHGAPLPPHPIMLTLDDADGSQFSNALPELDKAGYKGVFFVMTVVLNRPGYFTRDQVKTLFSQGHTIGCHTWDHHMTTKYNEADWTKQVEKPRAELAKITGSSISYFAYPFGLWNVAAVQHLKKYGFTASFRLAGKSDPDDRLFTIGRQIVDGSWSAQQLLKNIERIESQTGL